MTKNTIKKQKVTLAKRELLQLTLLKLIKTSVIPKATTLKITQKRMQRKLMLHNFT